MATIVLRTPTLRPPPARLSTNSFNYPKLTCFSFRQKQICSRLCRKNSLCSSNRKLQSIPLASHGDTTETQEMEEVQESEIQDNADAAAVSEDGTSGDESIDAEEPASAVIASLEIYKEALASNDESKVAEIEAFLKAIEDEKIDLGKKVAMLSEELSYEKARILRISADFDNFRKRTDRERLSLVANAQGELVESLLPVLDNFERAKSQIKVESEGEEKINNSYQSIYKQFVEILVSIGVVPVETIGKPFDPLLHEAIMRGESTEFEEGIIIEEFRRGFKLGDRLLRPSMVKVSAGPGPAKPESAEASEGAEDVTKTSEEGSAEAGSEEDL